MPLGRWLAPVPRTGSQLPFHAIAWFGKTAKWADTAGVSNAKEPCCKWSSRAPRAGPPRRNDVIASTEGLSSRALRGTAQVLSFRRPRFLAFARNDKLFESPVLGPVSEQLVSAATSRTPCGRGKTGQELSPSPRPYSNPCEPQHRR